MKNIPQVNFIYWLLMIIATTTGEILGNYISRDLNLGYKVGSVILVSLFIISIIYEIKNNKNSLLFYWFLIILGNIAGTNVADLICIQLDLGTIYGSLLVIATLIIILIAIFYLKKNEVKNSENKTEFLYWFAILSSSTFGTTSGDFLSNDTSLGADGGTVLLVILLLFFCWIITFKKNIKRSFLLDYNYSYSSYWSNFWKLHFKTTRIRLRKCLHKYFAYNIIFNYLFY